MIGTRLTGMLLAEGFEVAHLSRAPSGGQVPTFTWDIGNQEMEVGALDGVDYIIHLAGANLADKRWTADRKKEIIRSRIDSARLLYRQMEKQDNQVKGFISASAVGYYCDRGNEVIRENDPPGDCFVGKVCQQWEAAALQFGQLGKRVVINRIGFVLAKEDGALPQMVQPMQYGIAGYFGNGTAIYPWIHIDDVCGIFIHAIQNKARKGAYNAVAPHPLPNKELVKGIRDALGKKALLLPGQRFALRIMLGELAETLFYSQNVSNEKILEAGYQFQFTNLAEAVKSLYDVENS